MISSLEYNTERNKLNIPEYGRHIQKLVEHCKSLPSKEERNKMAHAIIGVMGNLNPHLRDVPDFQHKLWDQLFIIADFDLDVESPYPIPDKEELEARPERMSYPQKRPKYRFYGNNIQNMIDVAVSWEKGEKREALTFIIANHMKKSFLNWNKDSVDDSVIFGHLFEMSDGAINLAAKDEDLLESKSLIYRNTNSNRSRNNNHRRNNGKKNNRNNQRRRR
ncbi:hypothetical protein JCM19294_768 [Nonlabens tegetincola]|uniref:Uncharacterized protein n=1 Tax=Nonlabens tegetincola TaxID=323273 RepID=A0A090Q564_9FLAO|nr:MULTISPECIES: DUF4290 domain-containing protein [Nonlabens]ALM19897.1 methionyl-tRNA formyltransferase [Nonlabens sp. MIC269]ARN71069.1 methionyl-tRNA formyltransferase [Nonlabens tegetincola]MEE2802006.1 DUF4290 domain-containing protein [Bacteroidota bacterium]GAK98135.1 hypothetical protein JCM19294_768 [Nonlabens tegetincola]